MALGKIILVSCLFMAGLADSLCFPAGSDGDGFSLEKLEEKINSSEISFSYTYSAARGNITMSGKGKALLQGEAFRLEVDGMEVYCDGVTMWTLDREAEELVIEHYDGLHAGLAANPAVLLCRVSEFFCVDSQLVAEYGGVKALKVDLEPVSDSGFDSVTLYFGYAAVESDILLGASIVTSDGIVTDFRIVDFEYGSEGDLSRFGFDTSSLDDSWIITDMR